MTNKQVHAFRALLETRRQALIRVARANALLYPDLAEQQLDRSLCYEAVISSFDASRARTPEGA